MHEQNTGRSSRQLQNGDEVGSGIEGPGAALVAFLVILALAIVFIVSNRDEVEIHFLFWSPKARVWTALLTSTAIGVALDRIFLAWWRRRRRSTK